MKFIKFVSVIGCLSVSYGWSSGICIENDLQAFSYRKSDVETPYCSNAYKDKNVDLDVHMNYPPLFMESLESYSKLTFEYNHNNLKEKTIQVERSLKEITNRYKLSVSWNEKFLTTTLLDLSYIVQACDAYLSDSHCYQDKKDLLVQVCQQYQIYFNKFGNIDQAHKTLMGGPMSHSDNLGLLTEPINIIFKNFKIIKLKKLNNEEKNMNSFQSLKSQLSLDEEKLNHMFLGLSS